MELNAYQVAATRTAQYPFKGGNLLYPALGLAGEAGETVDKIKKLWRNKGQTAGSDLSPEDRLAILHELGDVLWYIAALAGELTSSLNEIAALNIAKLQDRTERGVIKSEGDNR